MKKFLLLFAFSTATICRAPATPKPQTPRQTTQHETVRELQSADKLFVLLDARLGLMRGVALAKWRDGGAIEDKKREVVVIEKARQSAARAGLRNIDALTRTQIEMAKAVQRHWHRRWASEGLSGREIAPPLTTIRARITSLDAQILAALKNAAPALHNETLQPRLRALFLQRLKQGAFTNVQRELLLQAARQVRFASTSSTR